MEVQDAPRQQHYYFAHIYLRDRAEQSARHTVDLLRRESGTNYLSSLWVTRGLAMKAETDEFIPADGLECFPVEIGSDYYGASVQLPAPERTAEAYFVAFVLPVGADYSTKAGFYTLEFSQDKDNPPQTALCQWLGETHLNLGAGPEPEKEAFVKALRRLLLNNGQKIGDIKI